MDKGKIIKIGIIGQEMIGKTIVEALNNKCALHSVADSQFSESKKVFEITKLPELPEIWIDKNEPIFNQKKHNETCLKNRKKRKKKKRR